jgi:hypothetical protein
MKTCNRIGASLLMLLTILGLSACASSSIPEGECELSRDCPTNLVCRNFQCIVGGSDGGLCPGTQQMVDGRCQEVTCACTSDEDCPDQRCVNCMCYDRLCEAGQTQDCATACGGKQECRDGVWQPCRQPETERCGDNVDNDCNGETDEGCTCADDDERPCPNECGGGSEICSNGMFAGCSAPSPRAEVCGNGIDENCDGRLDDGCDCTTAGEVRECVTACGMGMETCNGTTFENCSAPSPQDEFCDGVDNDCNGEIDDNLARNCGNACSAGTESCVGGTWLGCTASDVCMCMDGQVDEQVCSVPGGTPCGTRTRTCSGEQWGAWSDCGPKNNACTPGTVVEGDCPTGCGTERRVCTATCEWSVSPCSGSGECVPDERRESPVMDACIGTPEVCDAQCRWVSDAAPGSDEGACTTMGEVENAPCGNCGERSRTCLPCFRWSAWSECTGEPADACVPGGQELEGCGANCQTRARNCQADCTWSNFGECSAGGQCNPAQTQTESCGLCGDKLQTCNDNCIWEDTTSCRNEGVCDPNDSDVSEEVSRCDQALGSVGVCGRGYTSRTCNASTCQWDDWNACEVQPTAEVCGDGQDQDCNGADTTNPDQYEPNDACATCTLLSTSTDPSGEIEGRLDHVSDTDYYCFWADDGFSIFGPETIVIDLLSIPDNADYDVYLYQGLGEDAAARQANAISNCQEGPSRSLNKRSASGALVEGYNSGNEDERISWDERFDATDTGFYIIHVKAVYGSTCTEDYTLRHRGLD